MAPLLELEPEDDPSSSVWRLRRDSMTCSITPMNLLFVGGRTMRRATRWLTVAAVLWRPNESAVGALRMWCSGERNLPSENHAMSLASERVRRR